MSFISLESQFADHYRNLERAVAVQDYERAISLIQSAMQCCERLYQEAVNSSQKNKWQTNAQKLQKIYADCKAELEKRNPNYKVPKPVQPKQPKPIQKEKEVKKSSEKKESIYDNINYVANNINVKNFLSEEANENVTFDDVCGMEAEKKLISREFFISEEQKKFRREYLKKKNKNFILLYGVPGTGKTYFAKAISNEFKKRNSDVEIPFFCVACSKLMESKVGGVENNIIAVFEFASQFEQCVLFLDELDAIVPDRNKETGDPTARGRVTTFLQQVNGFSSSDGTLVIGATNFPDLLDGAVLSRANEQLEIPLPSIEVIQKMLERKIGPIINEEVDLTDLSQKLEGYSSRDVDHFVDKLKDYVDDMYKKEENEDYTVYKITPEMIKDALSEVNPTTKSTDLLRIKMYRKDN